MILNYKLICAGVDETFMLNMVNEALRLQDVKEPTPMQIETCIAGVALAAKVHAARKGNMLLFWNLAYGDVFPYPHVVDEAIRRGGQER